MCSSDLGPNHSQDTPADENKPASGQKMEHVQKVIDEGASAVCLNTDQLIFADAMALIADKCHEMKIKE